MDGAANTLWRVNNEYRKRLSQAQTFLDLLEQMILAHNGDRHAHTLAVLRYAREQVEAIIEEHRLWRYRFYYESTESKRMVQGDKEVNQALARFSRMRIQHETRLSDVTAVLDGAQRPDPNYTHVPNGDLWIMTQYAINDLLGFSDYLNTLGPVN